MAPKTDLNIRVSLPDGWYETNDPISAFTANQRVVPLLSELPGVLKNDERLAVVHDMLLEFGFDLKRVVVVTSFLAATDCWIDRSPSSNMLRFWWTP
jgi:hypothetical protein